MTIKGKETKWIPKEYNSIFTRSANVNASKALMGLPNPTITRAHTVQGMSSIIDGLKKRLDRLLAEGNIRLSTSPYGSLSPSLKRNPPQMCIDYRVRSK
jgi:hypothetical protein